MGRNSSVVEESLAFGQAVTYLRGPGRNRGMKKCNQCGLFFRLPEPKRAVKVKGEEGFLTICANPECGVDFWTDNKRQKFHEPSCGARFHQLINAAKKWFKRTNCCPNCKEDGQRRCKKCGTWFWLTEGQYKVLRLGIRPAYCSACQLEKWGPPEPPKYTKTCKECKNQFETNWSNQVFCDGDCRYLWKAKKAGSFMCTRKRRRRCRNPHCDVLFWPHQPKQWCCSPKCSMQFQQYKDGNRCPACDKLIDNRSETCRRHRVKRGGRKPKEKSYEELIRLQREGKIYVGPPRTEYEEQCLRAAQAREAKQQKKKRFAI